MFIIYDGDHQKRGEGPQNILLKAVDEDGVECLCDCAKKLGVFSLKELSRYNVASSQIVKWCRKASGRVISVEIRVCALVLLADVVPARKWKIDRRAHPASSACCRRGRPASHYQLLTCLHHLTCL